MEKFKCKECEREFDNIFSLKIHRGRIHKITAEQTYVDYVLNGIDPVCKCGCGNKPKFLGINEGFREFVNGHNSRVINNYQSNPEIKLKSAKTQSENWKKGKYKGWWEDESSETKEKIEGIKEKLRNNVERGNKISKALSNIPKSDKHKYKLSELAKQRYIDRPELRDIMSIHTINRLLKNNYRNPKTKLETKFEIIIFEIGFIPIYQYQIKTAIFDFYLPANNLLIEIDGDFHHCNPKKYKEPIYQIQKKTVSNDKRKNKIAKDEKYNLIRFWEKDINERPDWVIEQLYKKIENIKSLK